MTKLLLKNMVFYGYHGVFSAEKEMGQRLEVDVELYPVSEAASESDDIDLAVNYVDVYGLVKEIVEGQELNLLETIAHRIADRVMDAYDLAKIVVRVRKPHAPIGGPLDYVEAEVVRTSEDYQL